MSNNRNRNRQQGGGGADQGNSPVKLRVRVDGEGDRKDCRIVATLNYPGRPENITVPIFLLQGESDQIGVTYRDANNAVVMLVFTNGVANLEHQDFSGARFKKCTHVKLVQEYNGKEYDAKAALPSATDLPPGAQAEKEKVSVTGADELFVIFEPVLGSHDQYSAHGVVRSNGKGFSTQVYLAGTGFTTETNGTFTQVCKVSGHQQVVTVREATQPDLSITATLYADNASESKDNVQSDKDKPSGFRIWWEHYNNRIAIACFLIGCFLTLRLVYGLYETITQPFAGQSVSQQETKPAWQLRKERMESKTTDPGKKKVVRTARPGTGLGAVVTCVLYWAFFWFVVAPLCFYDELIKAFKATSGKFAHKRERIELRAVRQKTETGFAVFRYENGKAIGEKPESAEHGEAKREGMSWLDFIKRDIMVEAGLKFVVAILGRYFPFLKHIV